MSTVVYASFRTIRKDNSIKIEVKMQLLVNGGVYFQMYSMLQKHGHFGAIKKDDQTRLMGYEMRCYRDVFATS